MSKIKVAYLVLGHGVVLKLFLSTAGVHLMLSCCNYYAIVLLSIVSIQNNYRTHFVFTTAHNMLPAAQFCTDCAQLHV